MANATCIVATVVVDATHTASVPTLHIVRIRSLKDVWALRSHETLPLPVPFSHVVFDGSDFFILKGPVGDVSIGAFECTTSSAE